MNSISTLHNFLPDVQNAFCESYASAECSVEISPELTEPPFNFSFRALGKKIHLLASKTPLVIPKDFYQVSAVTEGVIVTDGLAGECIHLVLENGDDWRTPLQQAFNKTLSFEWSFLVLELQHGSAFFHILRPLTETIKKFSDCTILWLAPLSMSSPPKPKLVKKVAKKLSTEKSALANTNTLSTAITAGSGAITNTIITSISADSSSTANSVKSTKTSTGVKILRKKASSNSVEPKANNDGKVDLLLMDKKSSALMNKELNNAFESNGEISADSGVSVADSDNEKWSSKNGSANLSEDDRAPLGDNSTPRTTPDFDDAGMLIADADVTLAIKSNNDSNSSICANNGVGKKLENGLSNDNFSTSLTLKLQNNASDSYMTQYKLDSAKRMEKIAEEEENQKSESSYDSSDISRSLNGSIHENGDWSSKLRKNHINSVVLSRTARNSDLERNLTKRIENGNRFAAPGVPPVQVLQLVLKKFSYAELGKLRQVHPHWDELCGQALNLAYFDLVRKAERLLADCQRLVLSEPQLHDILANLTAIQVHILNPIDIIRPAIDEGVCCFVYGELLDKTFEIVYKAADIVNERSNMTVDWKTVADLAKRAQIHYKLNRGNIMEEKLGEMVRLKAMQSLQRIDSFIVDSTVHKLEKAAHMAHDEVLWEIEQLRHQNTQLKKDNRELKKDSMKLESRVEILENKFKTMARLLQ